jgi:hypothetical protein
MRNEKGQFVKGNIPWTQEHGHSIETRKKLSEARKGCPAWNKGIPTSEETKEKLRVLNLGKTIPQSVRNKISKSLKGQNLMDKNGNWKGGKFTRKDGYVFIYSPYHPHRNIEGYVMEHRLVIEQAINRFLKPTEIIHHINHNRSDNRLDNLEYFENHSSHMNQHWKQIKLQ